MPSRKTQVLIVGSGPVGATYARKLVDQGIDVLMVEMGAQERPIIGDHMKNSIPAQKNINKFMDVIKGQLDQLSVEVGGHQAPTIEPISYHPDEPIIQNGSNPLQKPDNNLRGAAASRTVGGMSAHWTCCTPRQHRTHERSKIFTEEQWDSLYKEAETLLGTNSTSFDSIRQRLLLKALNDAYPDGSKKFSSLPLACSRSERNSSYVKWSSSATILGEEITSGKAEKHFELLPQHQCMELKRGGDGKIKYATVKDLLGDEEIRIEADKYVVCAGAILTPGILWKSGFKKTHPALGRFLTEQTLAFCQVILKSDLVKNIPGDNLGCQHALDKHKEKFDEDPVPFPFEDDDPQIYLPVTEDRLWHAQIHRDAFSYGQTPPGIDQRLVVDLRFFGPVKPTSQNRVEFSDSITDAYGMPQPTFYYKLSTVDACIAHDMMSDMIQVARHLGGWVPGSEPKMLEPGASLHICGTTRAGTKIEDSVVNEKSQVWKCENLYLGGCNVIPGPNASNPTLTAICFALEGAEDIIRSFKPAPK